MSTRPAPASELLSHAGATAPKTTADASAAAAEPALRSVTSRDGTTIAMPSSRRIAVCEPPLFRDRTGPASLLRKFDGEMADGNLGAAMVTAMRGAEMGPGWFRALPKALSARLLAMGMKQEAKQPAGEYPTMRELAPTLHSDFAIVTASSGRLDDFRSIQAEVF